MDGPALKFVLSSAFVVAFSFLFIPDLDTLVYNLIFKEKHTLIIGILSAPENFQNRDIMRKTWLKLAANVSAVHYFVIGEHLCRIHPADRISPYSCVESRLSLPENVTAKSEFDSLKARTKSENRETPTKLDSIGFGFFAVSDITVTKLGVVKSVAKHAQGDWRIKLVSSNTKKTLASVTVSPESTSAENSHFVFKWINSVSLPRNTEAQVVLEPLTGNLSFLPSCEHFEWNFTPGAIDYLQLLVLGHRKPWPFRTNSCSYVVMSYTITDLNAVKAHVLRKKRRQKGWTEWRKKVLRQLKNESVTYGDVMFLDVVDVYRNLPLKLVLFLKKLRHSQHFHFVMKVDDDSFVDLLRIYAQLSSVLKQRELTDASNGRSRLPHYWWWSKFREFWKVQETGKWRDDEYRSAGYPTFPCGGGYVLSRGIVDYLTGNFESLRFFQGEDVSVGIWLSGVKTIQHYVPMAAFRSDRNRIQEALISSFGGDSVGSKYQNSSGSERVSDACEWVCDDERPRHVPACNKVQLSPAQMSETWQEYLIRGFV